MAPFREGMRVRGRFRLLTSIGAGGMSQVWRAHDELLDREVALKLLSSPGEARPAPRSATVREARLAAGLSHPNLTQVYDCGEATLPDGTVVPYLVMELVDGENLADRLASGPLPWPEAARVGAEVARALASVHRAGVVHRDVKPGNVVLTPAGAKLLDFGIAARCGSRGERGRLVGTPTYAAPERLDVDTASPESDVYSLGVLCYETLTGHPPVELPTWEHARQAHPPRRTARRRGGVPETVLASSLAGVPEPLARLCRACLALTPQHRPSAEQVANELDTLVAGQPSTVPPRHRYAVGTAPRPHRPTAPDPGRPRTPRRRGRLGVAVAVLLVTATIMLSVALTWPGMWSRLLGTQNVTGPGITAAAPPRSGPAPVDPYGTVSELDQTITRALATGAIDRQSARALRERIDDLYTELEQRDPRQRERGVRDRAADLRGEIARARAHGGLEPGVADRLTAQLTRLG